MSDLNARTPTGGDVTQRPDPQPAFGDDLLERVLQRANLQAAWRQVRANKGAAGVDGMTIDAFPDWAQVHWQTVKAQLRSGHYRPAPVKRVSIDKPDGGTHSGRTPHRGGCRSVEVL